MWPNFVACGLPLPSARSGGIQWAWDDSLCTYSAQRRGFAFRALEETFKIVSAYI